jgi:ACS family D-galactonate transporter-like MFS transporter
MHKSAGRTLARAPSSAEASSATLYRRPLVALQIMSRVVWSDAARHRGENPMSAIPRYAPDIPAPKAALGLRRLWTRKLPHYPDTAARTVYLGITVLATIVLYYQLYVQGAVATKIVHQFGFSFTGFVFVLVIGNAVGAFASLAAGLADRWGRANLVVGGLLVVGLLTAFALPNASSKAEYATWFALVSVVEGIALVATPALIRDFSPQVGRGAAMGFWTLGPVLGSLLVSGISSNTLDSHPAWQFQFHVAGAIGLVVAVVALLGLRELSPRLRDQLMHSGRERALVEARAAGIDSERALNGHWRQMLKLDIVGPAVAISVFLLLYFVFVGFLVLYFATVFGYSEARANQLANWYWISNAIALVVAGVASDRLRVRKPFMIVGALISLLGVALFAGAATNPDTGYHTFALYFVLMSFGGGVAYVAWMAAFTETVEKRNPAATATGLAVWGWIIRIAVTASFALLPIALPATTTLVEQGPRVQEIVAEYPQQIKVLQSVDAATLAALQANPDDRAAQARALSALSGLSAADVGRVLTGEASDPGHKVQQAAARLQSVSEVPAADLAYLSANAANVSKAQKDNPGQWQTWWWLCFAGQLVFIPFVFLMTGRWSPRRAREDEAAHERLVERELAALQTARTVAA